MIPGLLHEAQQAGPEELGHHLDGMRGPAVLGRDDVQPVAQAGHRPVRAHALHGARSQLVHHHVVGQGGHAAAPEHGLLEEGEMLAGDAGLALECNLLLPPASESAVYG